MKKNYWLICFLSYNLYAVDIDLNNGDSVVIQPANVGSKVHCGPDCQAAAKSFETTIENCLVTHFPGYCSKKYWPQFKASNPNCSYAAINICFDDCTQRYFDSYCWDLCQ